MTTTNQGYITMAIDNENSTMQVRSAYSLACSLRLVDPNREICLITDKFKKVPRKYEDAFDYIVELPFGVSDVTEPNKAQNLWQLYHCTPFDESIYVNPASIAVDNIESFWDTFGNDSVVFPSRTLNFKLEPSVYFEGRETFESNPLPNIHADVFYFKRDEFAGDYFKMVDIAFQNWRRVFFDYIKENRPDTFDESIGFALAAYMMGETLQPDVDVLEYTDLSPYNVVNIGEENIANWADLVNVWFHTGNKVKINNHRQTGFFVYHDFEIMTDETTDELRKYRKAATTKV